jgi:lipopolysaccharide transport system ATP-binding protein
MDDTVIRVENLGKLYRLGEIGTGTISHDLNRWWARVRGKDDPFAKVGQINDRTKVGDDYYVWALKDINFEVKKGEVLGIIGRNGAGKSTLLKILSKVTTPSTGQIKVKGRIASLLEVGTGFHPELTGRENIYLNGAILGMTKAEIRNKFNEIVDFAGVERYVDTPVKRYSSGMYVRLAFSVAAHLDPDILVVDEVLAVGDVEFQKKCLGRMKRISAEEGRTVLFVSHNFPAVKALCTKSILLSNGGLIQLGETNEILSRYLDIANINIKAAKNPINNKRPGEGSIRITDVQMLASGRENVESILQGENLTFLISTRIANKDADLQGLHFSVTIHDQFGSVIVNHSSRLIGLVISKDEIHNMSFMQFTWSEINLTPGKYTVSFDIVRYNQYIDLYNEALYFYVLAGIVYNYKLPADRGIMAIDANWSIS